MKNQELFEIWAPPHRVWAEWAKPVLFATAPVIPGMGIHTKPEKVWPQISIQNDGATALLIELPREFSVQYGIAAARIGFWPVPLFNSAFGPNAVLDLRFMLRDLVAGAAELTSIAVPDEAPPAFLSDSRRMDPDRSLLPGNFDNRYILFPQDFPSGGFLKSRGLQRMVVLRKTEEWPQEWGRPADSPDLFRSWQRMHSRRKKERDDLAHILFRWQEAGLAIDVMDLARPALPLNPMTVRRPSRFRSLFYRGLALLGLRRNSAGGFGGIIPQESSGG